MATRETLFGTETRYRLFTALKYLTYALLTLNVYLFLQEELLALQYTFRDHMSASDLIQVFSATIDTAAWVILLILFELETSVLDDSRIRGAVKWSLHGMRGLCYIAVVYAFTGYWSEMVTLYHVSPLARDACSLAGSSWSLLVDLDEYVPIAVENCAALGSDALRLSGFEIAVAPDTLRAARYLAWTDVINAGAWILVVVALEVDVWLQLRGHLRGRLLRISKIAKVVLYGTLFVAAGYWGLAGSFLDFWDAALWLFAFIFIELNVFEWQYESSMEAREDSTAFEAAGSRST